MRRVTPSDRRSAADGHILIGGTGRAGTTLLVQWFTALGFDTGFDLDDAVARVDPISHGGLEHSLGRSLGSGERLPYVAKSPWYGNRLGEFLARGELRVRAVVIPMRDLFAAAESRRNVSQRAEEAGRDPLKHPGGAIGVGQAGRAALAKQEQRLARQFYELVHTLVEHEVPFYFLRFPDFAQGRQDLYAALRPLLVEHGVTEAECRAALEQVLRPELIHDFPAEPSAGG
jgi:hypothetical protein